MKKFAFVAAAALIAAPAFAQDDIVQTDQKERWYYVSQSGPDFTNRERAGVWSVDGANLTHFQRRSSLALIEFSIELPVGIDAPDYEITEAEIVAYALKNPAWTEPVIFELFAPGYGGAYPTPASFDIVSSPYVGGKNPPGIKDDRYPFLLGLDGSNADETTFPNAQAWATGTFDSADIDPLNDNAIPVTFTLNVSDPVVQARLKQDIADGKTRWFISCDTVLAGFPSPPVPNFYQQPSTDPAKEIPTLTLKVTSTASSVPDWMILH